MTNEREDFGAVAVEQGMKKLSDYPIGTSVTVMPSRYGNHCLSGTMFVVGHIAPSDLKLARRPGDNWEVISHLQTIEGSGW